MRFIITSVGRVRGWLLSPGSREPPPEADQIRRLAALLRSGMTARLALIAWPGEADDGDLRSVSRRARLGADIVTAVRALERDSGRALAAIFQVHVRAGADLAEMLDVLAEEMEERSRALEIARAHGAGAHLSARMVALLPLAFLLLLPGAARSFGDVTVMTMLAIGAALAVAGVRWIGHLLPVPEPVMEPSEVAAVVCAASARAGADHPTALRALAAIPDADPEFRRAARRVRLGLSWGTALTLSDRGHLRTLGEYLRQTEILGVPPSPALDRVVAAIRGARRSRSEGDARRAAVKMVVPLTLCVLPAFVLLAFGPHLRGVIS